MVWDQEDYVKEASSQLGDSSVYDRLDSDPPERLGTLLVIR